MLIYNFDSSNYAISLLISIPFTKWLKMPFLSKNLAKYNSFWVAFGPVETTPCICALVPTLNF
jgi:hypothetical protein